jgi:hypothetical protein
MLKGWTGGRADARGLPSGLTMGLALGVAWGVTLGAAEDSRPWLVEAREGLSGAGLGSGSGPATGSSTMFPALI